MWDLIVSVPEHCLSFYFTVVTVFFLTFAWPFQILFGPQTQ